MMDGEAAPSLAGKLDLLFRTKHAGGEAEVKYRDVALALAERGGPTVTETYLYMLRTGRRTNPRVELLSALAGYFEVPLSYFFEDDATGPVSSQLRLLAAMRDAGVDQVALRAADLSPAGRDQLAQLIEQLRKSEGIGTSDSADES